MSTMVYPVYVCPSTRRSCAPTAAPTTAPSEGPSTTEHTPLTAAEKKAGQELLEAQKRKKKRNAKKKRQKQKKRDSLKETTDAAPAAPSVAAVATAATNTAEEAKAEAKREKNRKKRRASKAKKRASKLEQSTTPNTTTPPCSTYVLDKNGDFGTCTCGHLKAAHGEAKQNNAEAALKHLKQKNSSKDMTVATAAGKCCTNYRVDASGDFGACVCGHLKAAHEEAKQNNAEAALEQLKKKNSSKDMTVATAAGTCCTNYRVDASGDFGACVCGHPKAAHEEQSQNKAEAALEELKQKNSANKTVERRASQGGAQCGNYRVDPTATEFATCLCGHSKAAHEKQVQNKAEAALEKLNAKNAANKTVERRASQGGAQCGNYRVDPTATEFATCLCGHPKAAHEEQLQNKAEAALEKLNAKNKGLNDKRKHTRTKSGGACGDFRLDTASSGAFGLCLCGHGKAQHQRKSLDNAAKALNALRENNDSKAMVFQHDSIDGQSCKNYVLDMTGTNFGDCKCGISKKEHANDCMPGTKAYKTRILKEKEEAKRLQREKEAREAAEAARIVQEEMDAKAAVEAAKAKKEAAEKAEQQAEAKQQAEEKAQEKAQEKAAAEAKAAALAKTKAEAAAKSNATSTASATTSSTAAEPAAKGGCCVIS